MKKVSIPTPGEVKRPKVTIQSTVDRYFGSALPKAVSFIPAKDKSAQFKTSAGNGRPKPEDSPFIGLSHSCPPAVSNLCSFLKQCLAIPCSLGMQRQYFFLE